MDRKSDKTINGYTFTPDDTDEQTMYYAQDWYPENCYVVIQEDGLFQAVHYGECLSADVESAQEAIEELEEMLNN